MFYEPGAQQALPHTPLKNYRSVLDQSAAFIWTVAPESGGTARESIEVTLDYGSPVVLKTDDESSLLISSGASPP